jgi:hypothetical protein
LKPPQRYPFKSRRVEAFLHLLCESAQVPAEWDTQRHGAGVLDAAALIGSALPGADLLHREV